MQHAGQREILHEGEARRDLSWDVDARDRRADQLVRGRRLDGSRDIHLQCDGTLGREHPDINALRAARMDHPIDDAQILDTCTQARRGAPQQFGTQCRGGVTQLHAALLDGQAAVRRALIRRQRRVALDQRDVSQRNVQLVGDNLHEGGLNAGAEIDLSGIEVTWPLGSMARNPCTASAETDFVAAVSGASISCGVRSSAPARAARDGERNDERARALQQRAPIQGRLRCVEATHVRRAPQRG